MPWKTALGGALPRSTILIPSVGILVAVLLGVLALVFLTGQGGEAPLFQGVPDEQISDVTLRKANAVPAVPKGQAIAAAIESGTSGPTDSRVRETVLLWLTEDDTVDPPVERLVWGVSFDDPSAVDLEVPIGAGAPERPEPEVEYEARYVIVLVDALTGEHVMTMEGYAPAGKN